jgi:cation diffusion facilitator CzcD-associated flavoprotein CzcO
VLYGGHDRLVSARAAARARRMFRGADVVVDPGAGHIPQREDPAGTAAVLLRRAGSPSPVTAPTAGRATTRVRVVVVGSGFSGLAAAVRLRRAGHHDLLVLERGDEVGGTWRDNTYPGCACDIPSHLYSLSFAPNPGWSRRFSGQAEILRYLQRVADDFGVTPRIRLRTRMTSARWDPGLRRWVLETSTGRVEAEVLVLATGPLAEPSVPDVPGATEFEGRMFHSARWDHDLDLTGRRVVVVGTGASAVQFVPRIAPQVAALTVLQRTAPWVQPRGDREVPHWQRALHRAVPPTQTLARAGVYASREAVAGAMLGNRALQRFAEAACLRHLRSQVADPVLRARLTPSYRIGCKRVLLSDDWYPALTLPHVEVVDSALKRLRPDGVVTASGRFVPADTVVFGTGFSVTDSPTAGLVRGTDGRSLAEVWDGHPQAYLGTAYPGFPNLFHLGGPNTGLGHNSVVVMFEAQLDYVLTALRALDGRPDASIEPTAAALQRYDDELRRRMRRTVWATGGCASWYMDARGEVAALWPDRVGRFRRRMREFVPQDHVVTVPTGVRP